jgi:hypothetical protein
MHDSVIGKQIGLLRLSVQTQIIEFLGYDPNHYNPARGFGEVLKCRDRYSDCHARNWRDSSESTKAVWLVGKGANIIPLKNRSRLSMLF